MKAGSKPARESGATVAELPPAEAERPQPNLDAASGNGGGDGHAAEGGIDAGVPGRARRAGRPERRVWATFCQAAERAGNIGTTTMKKAQPKSARQIVEGRSANSPRSGVAIFLPQAWLRHLRAKTRPLWRGRTCSFRSSVR